MGIRASTQALINTGAATERSINRDGFVRRKL